MDPQPRRQPFVAIDRKILEQYGEHIKPAGIALYCALLLHDADAGPAVPIDRTALMANTGINSDAALARALGILAAYGLIAIDGDRVRTLWVP